MSQNSFVVNSGLQQYLESEQHILRIDLTHSDPKLRLNRIHFVDITMDCLLISGQIPSMFDERRDNDVRTGYPSSLSVQQRKRPSPFFSSTRHYRSPFVSTARIIVTEHLDRNILYVYNNIIHL